MSIINIIRGIAIYGFFISLFFLCFNYFISKLIKNDVSVFISLILSIFITFDRIIVIWK